MAQLISIMLVAILYLPIFILFHLFYLVSIPLGLVKVRPLKKSTGIDISLY